MAGTDTEMQAALAEECDLSREERVRILAAERDVETRTLWDVLGLTGEPSQSDIKKAYFKLSKAFHPDRYFGKDLGSFKDRIERVFQGIKQAYETLGKPNKRAKYAQKHPPPKERAEVESTLRQRTAAARRSPKGGARKDATPQKSAEEKLEEELKRRERRQELNARREEMIAARRRKAKAPAESRAKQAKDLYDEGMEKLRNKELMAAARSLGIAASFAPNNKEYADRYAEVNQAAISGRCRELAEAADIDAATGAVGAAANNYVKASDLMPSSNSYAQKAAELLLLAGEVKDAKRYIERAIAASPRRKETRVLAAEYYEDQGEMKTALSHIEIAASLDKGDSHVKKMLKRITKAAS